jgi:hypothetical protein
MKDVITIGGIALIGWALYEWLMGSSSVVPATTSTGSTPASTTPAIANPTAAQLVAAAQVGTAGTLTPQQWNYYWMQITGQTTTFTPANLTQKITAAAYLSLRSAAGLGAFMASTILADRQRQRLTLSGMGGFQPSTILRDRARVRLTN